MIEPRSISSARVEVTSHRQSSPAATGICPRDAALKFSGLAGFVSSVHETPTEESSRLVPDEATSATVCSPLLSGTGPVEPWSPTPAAFVTPSTRRSKRPRSSWGTRCSVSVTVPDGVAVHPTKVFSTRPVLRWLKAGVQSFGVPYATPYAKIAPAKRNPPFGVALLRVPRTIPPWLRMETAGRAGFPKTDAAVGLGTIFPPGVAPSGIVIVNGPATGVAASTGVPHGRAGSSDVSEWAASNVGVHSRTAPASRSRPHANARKPAPNDACGWSSHCRPLPGRTCSMRIGCARPPRCGTRSRTPADPAGESRCRRLCRTPLGRRSPSGCRP